MRVCVCVALAPQAHFSEALALKTEPSAALRDRLKATIEKERAEARAARVAAKVTSAARGRGGGAA